jgi:hypothetical protein
VANRVQNLRDTMSDEEIVDRMQADFDRRRSWWWGRFLLWLLRKTT